MRQVLLISLPHEIDEKYVKRIADLVHPMEVLVERDIHTEWVPIDQIEILITYGKQVNVDTLDVMTSLK